MRTRSREHLFLVCGTTLFFSWLVAEGDCIAVAAADSADPQSQARLRLEYAKRADVDYILTLEQRQYVGRRLDADWDSPTNALSNRFEAHLQGRMGSGNATFQVTKFSHQARLGSVVLETLGVEHVVGCTLVLPLLPQGPSGLLQVEQQGDALAFSGSHAYLQSIRQWLQLGMLVLPKTALEVGDIWRKQRQARVDIPGLPDMVMEVVSWYFVLGVTSCGQQQCALIGEVYWVWSSTLRSLEKLIQLNLWGVGQAHHRFALDSGKPYHMQGRAVMDMEVAQYQADGAVVYGTESTFTSVYQLRQPSVPAAGSWKPLRYYDPD